MGSAASPTLSLAQGASDDTILQLRGPLPLAGPPTAAPVTPLAPLVPQTSQMLDMPDMAGVAQPAKINLADAVLLTISRHPQIARGLAAVARSQADVGVAEAQRSPQVSYQANLGPNLFSGDTGALVNSNTPGPSITLQQLLYDFGRSRGEIGRAAAIEKQRRFELEATADQLAEKGGLAFLEVKRYEARLAASEQQLAGLSRLRDLIGMRVEAGISDRSDLTLAESRVQGARADAIQAKSALTTAQLALGNLTGAFARGFDDPHPTINRFIVEAQPIDFNTHPQIAAAAEAERAAAARVGQIEAEKYPKLGVALGYQRNNYSYNRNDDAVTALVTVTGDIYRAGNRHAADAARHERRAAAAEKDAVVLELRGKLYSVREEIRSGAERISAFSLQEEQARRTSEIFFEEYKLGKRTLTELLNNELEVYRASAANIDADYDILAARLRNEALHGTLRGSLGVPTRVAGADDDV